MDNDNFQLGALSPLDGRYASETLELSAIWSEAGLMSARLKVEIMYLSTLLEEVLPDRLENNTRKGLLEDLCHTELWSDFQLIKDIETKGAAGFPATNHDVKAIEYFLQTRLKPTSFAQLIPFIHCGLTSEDVNNISYSLMVRDALEREILPRFTAMISLLQSKLVIPYANTPMLARTHGQPASPTTFGKEMAVFVDRLSKQITRLKTVTISVKLNGATGNYNALYVAFPKVDWHHFNEILINKLNEHKEIQFVNNRYTTQIEPHDTYAEVFYIMMQINSILIDMVQDLWRYISDEWVVQKPVEGEVGSSTMPHKVNPINFENAEGNLGLANCLFGFFAQKLPISRLQRDLSDSTVSRNFGVAFGYCLVAYSALMKGLNKISVNEQKIMEDLNNHPEVIAEAYQVILRTEGVADGYERLKEFTRGKRLTLDDLHNFVDSLNITESLKTRLKSITPNNYIGLAYELAEGILKA